MPQIKDLPKELRDALGIRGWNEDPTMNRTALRFIQAEWCGPLNYQDLCPFSERNGCKECIPALTEIASQARSGATHSLLGFLRFKLRAGRVAKIEAARLEKSKTLAKRSMSSASGIAEKLIKELEDAS